MESQKALSPIGNGVIAVFSRRRISEQPTAKESDAIPTCSATRLRWKCCSPAYLSIRFRSCSATRAFWVRDEVGSLFSSLAPVMTVLHRLLRLSFYGPTRALSTCSSDGILTELCTWATNNSSAFGISAFMNNGLSDINLEQGIAAWNFNTS